MNIPRSALLILCCVLSACDRSQNQPQNQPQTLTLNIAVAASVRYACDELVLSFQKANPGVQIKPTYGASGTFYAQLRQQAPFDLFLSADSEYPEQMLKQGLTDAVFPYARGRLLLWARRSAGLNVANRGLEVLTDPAVSRIAIANPDTAPYGRAALEAIRSVAGLEEKVSGKLVQAENVGQAAQFTQSGAAQVGIFAESLIVGSDLNETGDWLVISDSLYSPIRQFGAIPSWCRDRSSTEAFRDFLLSEEGQAILEKYGFSAP